MNKKFRKISAKLHLWLGLLSGIVVFIVCITGCLYAFKDEIIAATEPWRVVTPSEKAMLPPSEVLNIANTQVDGKKPTAITYGENYDAVFVDYFDFRTGSATVFLNPYDGEIIKTTVKTKDDFDFFRFILNGHRTLWLPREIGKPIVGYGVLIFLITLITGIILWWPAKWTKKAVKRNLTIKWKSGASRLNFDLHNVLGFYSTVALIILCFTGLIFSLSWFSKAVYSATSGGKELLTYTLPKSDTLQIAEKLDNPLDQLYYKLRTEEPEAKTFYFALPSKTDGVIRVSVVHKRNSYYRTDNLFFDQYTLIPLKGTGPYAGKYKEASAADQFRRMNLEIHDGRILGLPGKILAFIASLIGASLPVTGFIFWMRRKKKA